MSDPGRKDASIAESRYEGDPVTARVVRDNILIRSYDSPQIFTEGEVGRRAVIQGANAHRQDLTRHCRRLSRQARCEVIGNLASREDTGATSRYPDEIGASGRVDRIECGEHRRDENSTKSMWLADFPGRVVIVTSYLAFSSTCLSWSSCRWRFAARRDGRWLRQTEPQAGREGSPAPCRRAYS